MKAGYRENLVPVSSQVKMVYDLKNKVAFVTGAASGVGAAVVRELLEEGVKHVSVLDIAEDVGNAFQDELNAKYGADKVKFYSCDVTDEDTFLGVMADVKSKLGYIDVIVNNAGIMNDTWPLYKKEILINVLALVTGSLRGLEMMRQDEGGKGGTIINISSLAALCQQSALPVYWATKSAVLQFSNCLGLNDLYSRTGVRVIAVCPGATDTALITPQKLGTFDKLSNEKFITLSGLHKQKVESVSKGIIEAYKRGESGSTWVVAKDRPAVDITTDIKKAYDILAVHRQ